MAEDLKMQMLNAGQSNNSDFENNQDVVIDYGRIEPIIHYDSPDDLYQELVQKVRKYHPSDDLSVIEKAYRLASDAHEGQLRKSGEPYIIHPLCVSIILAELEMDKETIEAGLLHDVVEDTIYTAEEIRDKFGAEVALLVEGVTKLRNFNTSDHADEPHPDQPTDKLEMQAENLRKMFLAMAKDIRVILIKLADRLHNMRTLKYQPPEKQQRIARETLDIYSPIADRLGISKIKVELDDLSLKYLDPEAYYELVDRIASRRNEREKYIADIVREVSQHMINAGVNAKVDGRAKHFFSIYRKMKNQNKTLDQIYDLFAVRIIVDTVKDCYAALGVIHEMYTPIPGRFKDYIAMPKANMYQSLHTTLIGEGGKPFEIQIRTFEMHRAAEYGIAAHWKYKEASDGKKIGKDSEEEKMAWLRQILEWQQDTANNKEFMDLIKSDLDLFSDSVYCFTPTGEVKTLPYGSTPIDFAYAVHSAVGNRMIGARVNGKLVTIDYQIQNGDRVEILTSQNSKGPSRDWLNVVKSTQARNKINQWFKNELKDDNIVKGKEMMAAYCKAKAINQADLMKPAYMEAIRAKFGFNNWDAVLAAVGHGGLKEGQIINRMQEMYDKDHKKIITDEEIIAAVEENNKDKPVAIHSKGGIIVKGVHDVSVHFSKCCSPVPGDEIIGFVTRGRGISVHRTDCINIINLPEEDRARLIEAEWQVPEGEEHTGKYFADITIYANNRSGLLADISRMLTDKEIDILSVNTRTSKQGIATLNITFYVSGRDELKIVIEKLRTVESVLDVQRTSG